jgi:hypothetical protein
VSLVMIGTLIGAFALGLLNKLLEPCAGVVLAKIAVLPAGQHIVHSAPPERPVRAEGVRVRRMRRPILIACVAALALVPLLNLLLPAECARTGMGYVPQGRRAARSSPS